MICEQSDQHTMAYFYFNFQDIEQQDLSTIVRSMIRQLCGAELEIPMVVKALHRKCSDKNYTPTLEELISTLYSIIETLNKDVFIIVDALDEFPEFQGSLRRSELLKLLSQLVARNFKNLHMLMTSRDELDIREALGNLASQIISLQTSVVDPDIRALVSSRLSQGQLSRTSADVRAEIMEKVGNGAHGMSVNNLD